MDGHEFKPNEKFDPGTSNLIGFDFTEVDRETKGAIRKRYTQTSRNSEPAQNFDATFAKSTNKDRFQPANYSAVTRSSSEIRPQPANWPTQFRQEGKWPIEYQAYDNEQLDNCPTEVGLESEVGIEAEFYEDFDLLVLPPTRSRWQRGK